MVKAVVGEESRLKLAEDRLSQAAVPSQVGLVIGKLSKSLDKGFVFDLIPTPQNDAGEPACSLIESDNKKKGGSKAKAQSDSSALFIDKDWVAEHARQVSRMLVGGMKVVGVYVWVNESSFKNSTITLCQTVKGVADATPIMHALDERLLIHISYSPRRWTCRNCFLASNSTSNSLPPCDFKMGKVLTSLQEFRCTYNFDLSDYPVMEVIENTSINSPSEIICVNLFCTLPISSGNGFNIRKLLDIVRRGLSNHAKVLKGAMCLIDGKMVIEDEQCVSDGLHEVEFILPFMEDKSLEVCSHKEVVGLLVFSGSVSSLAFLNPKESISQALDDIKEDIITSLQSRLEILCDEEDQESGSLIEGDQEASRHTSSEKHIPEIDQQSQRKYCSLPFPRRVFVPWLAGTYICDYIQPSETIEVLKDHCVELMSMEAPKDASAILEPESGALTLNSSVTKSFWDIAGQLSSESKPDNLLSEHNGRARTLEMQQKAARSVDFSIIAAVVVLIISMLVGLVLFVFRS